MYLGEADRRRVETARRALSELWDPDYRLKVVHVVQQLVRADAAVAYRARDATGHVPVVHTLSSDSRSWSAIRNYPWLARFQASAVTSPSARRFDGRVVDLGVLASTRMRAEYREIMLAPNGFWHQLRTGIYRHDGTFSDYVGVYRTRRIGEFVERERARLEAVVPLLRESLGALDVLGERPLGATELGALLDALPVSAFVFHPSGLALFANAAATTDHRAIPPWAPDVARSRRANAWANFVRIDLDGRSLHVVIERRAERPRLSPRLGAVAELLAAGSSDRDIAKRLGLSHASARVYVARVRARLGLRRRFDVARAMGATASTRARP